MPRQRPHGVVVTICPRMLWRIRRTCPVPLHSAHDVAFVPAAAPEPSQSSQLTADLIDTEVRQPKTASTKSISICVSRSGPRCGPDCCRPPPPNGESPPKNASKMLPKPPAPPNGSPPPRPPPEIPASPNWSYRARVSSSDKTSYARLTSLNFSSASALFGFASGCNSRANLRYARFNSS